MNQSTFFKDLSILELSSVLAGPATGTFFSELGARVIKIENKRFGGDVTRKWRLPEESGEKQYSAYYCAVNWGKEVKMLDLTDINDRQVVYDLLPQIDIVISNFHSMAATKLGMDFKTLHAFNESLIFGHITGYGESDSTPAFDVVLQAETGYLFMTGEPGRPPVKMPVALIDILAAHQLKEGLLLAILKRYKTGEGSLVSVSLFDSAVASLANQATNWLEVNHIPQPLGSCHPNIAPYGDLVMTKDEKQIVLAAGTEKQFSLLCRELGLDDLVFDYRFSSNAARTKNRPELVRILKSSFLNLEFKDIHTRLKAAGVPCGSVRKMNEVFELPTAKELILEEEMEDGHISKRVRTTVFKLKSVHFDKK